MTPTNPSQDLVATLTGGQKPRVWSLLVTIFGDLAQGQDEWISGIVLNRIATEIGIRPEATRVALHRLRKDGWIVSRKNGRRRDYSLTPESLRQSAQASPRIYGDPLAGESCWLVLQDPDQKRDHSKGEQLCLISNNVAMTTGPKAEDLAFDVTSTNLPDWMRKRICDPALIQATQELANALANAKARLQNRDKLSPLQTAVLRVLIVHSWRRIILKAPNLPDAAFPQDWKGAECRKLSQSLLDQLKRPSLSELEQIVLENAHL